MQGMPSLQVCLVPRPFLPPISDRLQYAKTEGDGLGERVMCMILGRREGRREVRHEVMPPLQASSQNYEMYFQSVSMATNSLPCWEHSGCSGDILSVLVIRVYFADSIELSLK